MPQHPELAQAAAEQDGRAAAPPSFADPLLEQVAVLLVGPPLTPYPVAQLRGAEDNHGAGGGGSDFSQVAPGHFIHRRVLHRLRLLLLLLLSLLLLLLFRRGRGRGHPSELKPIYDAREAGDQPCLSPVGLGFAY